MIGLREKRDRPDAFLKGACVALFVTLPLTAWICDHFVPGFVDQDLAKSMILALIFAGLPAAITGGGLARRAAMRFSRNMPRALERTAQAGALFGLALIFVTAIPLSVLPLSFLGFTALAAAGASVGAGTGALTGLWIRRG